MTDFDFSYLFPRPKVRVLCLGTNRGRGAPTLRWAEKDAVDVARLFAGQVGCAPRATYHLAPSRDEVGAALAAIAVEKPDVLVVYNSGHGSPAGILLRDGILRYEDLADWIALIDAPHTVTLLDVCHAGSFLRKHATLGDVVIGGVDPTYLELLATATDSSRVLCSVGAWRLSHEGGQVDNGHFTASLLEAASRLPGLLCGWISDGELFAGAQQVSASRYGQQPLSLGLTGDLPLLRAQHVVHGGAALAEAKVKDNACVVSAVVTGRFGVPTTLRGGLVSQGGRILAMLEHRFVPGGDTIVETAHFFVSQQTVFADAASELALRLFGEVALTWHVDVCDLRNRVLARRAIPVRWGYARRAA